MTATMTETARGLPDRSMQQANRARLATQVGPKFAAGEEDDDDFDKFVPRAFAIGSTRTEDGARKFMSGFESAVDPGISRIGFNLERRYIFLDITPLTRRVAPPAFLPIRAEVPFEDIVTGGVRITRRPHPSDPDKYLATLTLSTRRPARFFCRLDGAAHDGRVVERRATERDFVFSTGVMRSQKGHSVEEMQARGYAISEAHAGPIQVIDDHSLTIKVSSWLTWQFDFVFDKKDMAALRDKLVLLRAAGQQDGLQLLHAREREPRIKVVAPETIRHVDPAGQLGALDFRLRYLVEGIVSHAIVLPSEVGVLLEALDEACAASEHKERVLSVLFNEERVCDVRKTVLIRAKQVRKNPMTVEPHQAWVYRCMVTPTRVILFPPEQETSNDALRKHNTKVDRFIRVQFTDEDDRIQINPTVKAADDIDPASGTLARVRRALDRGLQIAGRHYVFLAYGSSSAREHTCWFVAEDRDAGFTADGVRASLGFAGIKEKIIAKYAARMGIDGKLCFTDGVGICGRKVARQAALEFGHRHGVDAYPSAIQIRCGGIKGVLGVWPELCGSSRDVRFRDSQQKYSTPTHQQTMLMNVVRIAQFRRAFLNRQFIILLESLGVEAATLRDMFDAAIDQARGLTERFTAGTPTKEDLRAAVGLSQFPIKELYEAGFQADPVFVDACKVLETRMLADLKWKARLEVQDGVYLMGIADELGVLNEGEVFCQWRNPTEPGDGPTLVTGPCAVMRAPALHLGDIQIVKAVDNPALRHLVNVVVFPVRGRRPMPNMLAGGDLDGDDYTLIWDKRLIPDPKKVAAAAEYDTRQPKRVDQVTLDHVKEFFIDYIRNDILGQVSNAHLAFADKYGPGSRQCRLLHEQASIAVDFPKTGIPATQDHYLRPKEWPTFMGKNLWHNKSRNYTSAGILGQLFELVQPEPEFVPVDVRRCLPRVDARLEKFCLPDSLLRDAYRLKDYDVDVLGLMNRYRVTEAEVASGIILRNPKRRRGKDGDLKDPIDANYRALRASVLKRATEFLDRHRYRSPLPLVQLYAVAAYQVTCVPDVRARVEELLARGTAAAAQAEADDARTEGGRTDDARTDDASSVDVAVGEAGPPPMITFPWVFYEHILDLPHIKPGQAGKEGAAAAPGQAPRAG